MTLEQISGHIWLLKAWFRTLITNLILARLAHLTRADLEEAKFAQISAWTLSSCLLSTQRTFTEHQLHARHRRHGREAKMRIPVLELASWEQSPQLTKSVLLSCCGS